MLVASRHAETLTHFNQHASGAAAVLHSMQVGQNQQAQKRVCLERGKAHLHNGLPSQSGPKELPEGHQEVAAADAAQIEEGVRPRRQQEDAPETMPETPTQSCI
jgi:hypothetical protein